jgi:prepilin-type processing-associated H-X9-DG protein
MYGQDYDERNVPTSNSTSLGGNGVWWMIIIQPYVKNVQLLNCPSYNGGGYCGNTGGCEGGAPSPDPYRYFAGYGLNEGYDRIPATNYPAPPGRADAEIVDVAGTFAILDGQCVVACPSWRAGNTRHNEGADIAYCDGHVKWLKDTNIPTTAVGGWTITVGD